MLLSLCMIVKNEEDNLKRCLESVKDIVNEIIIVDTGSTDHTIEIAKKYGAKIFRFDWNNNFSDARNFSIDKASGEWILIMDADDELEAQDKAKLLKLLNNPEVDVYFLQTLSYVGDKPGDDIVSNLNVRLIRNNRGIKFQGAIHEQIHIDNNNFNKNKKICIEKVRFYHYGYLNKNIDSKNKRKRNIHILEKLIKKDENNGFNLFNLGNEYFALGDYTSALKYYKKSYKNFNPFIGYSPKLLLRMIMALDELNRYQEEFEIIEVGLKYYPNFTDLEFIKASLNYKLGNYLNAIKSFKKCISLGEPPLHLSFIVGVGSYRPNFALSQIYFELEDYNNAYYYSIETLKSKPDFLVPLYTISRILAKEKYTSNEIRSKLENFFGKNLNGFAYITLADIFFSLKKYDIAYDYLKKAEKNLGENEKLFYFKGKCLLNLKKYKEAIKCFNKIRKGKYYELATYEKILCNILSNNFNNAVKLLISSKKFCNSKTIEIYTALSKILQDKKCYPISNNYEESKEYVDLIFILLEKLLIASTPEIFEKSLQLLNLIECDEVLLKLAKLYYYNGYYNLSYQEFIRSIKIFNKIDIEGLKMMMKILYLNK